MDPRQRLNLNPNPIGIDTEPTMTTETHNIRVAGFYCEIEVSGIESATWDHPGDPGEISELIVEGVDDHADASQFVGIAYDGTDEWDMRAVIIASERESELIEMAYDEEWS